MSIIQEALRKAQGTKVNREAGNPKRAAMADIKETSRTVRIAAEPKPNGMIRPAFYVLIFFIVLSLLAVKYFSPVPVKTVAIPHAPVVEPYQIAPPKIIPSISDNHLLLLQPKELAVKMQPVPEPQPAVEKEDVPEKDDFVLSGIMHPESGPRAIVNGSVVIEGDVIDGMVVAKITNNSVVLKKKNLEIVVRLE